MQTFLPHADFRESARCLDMKRLGKQRIEVMQLLGALSGVGKGRANHPAAEMWRGSEQWLITYGLHVCDEWISRGYNDTCRLKIADFGGLIDDGLTRPWWLGDPAFHLAHQSNLVRKLPEHYGPMFPWAPDDLDYIWPRGIG